MDFIRTYGEPGAHWFGYTLNLDTGEYEVYNEGGTVVASHPWETEVQNYCEDASQGDEPSIRPLCDQCGLQYSHFTGCDRA